MAATIESNTVVVGGHGDLLLPGGVRVRNVTDTTFRGHLKKRLPHYDATWGRQQAEAEYASEYARISELGAAASINEWFDQTNNGS
jgi:hypothetical protein